MEHSITQEELKELLEYDELTGEFTNKTDRNHLAKKGMKAGSANTDGYIAISLEGKKYYAHRLAWLYMYGTIPESNLDHIDRDTGNNRISNLRVCDHSKNTFNSIKNDTTYYRGVAKNHNNYKARIYVEGKYIELGTYSTPEEASIVYEIKAKELQGDFYYDPQYTYNKDLKPIRLDRPIGKSGYRGVTCSGKKFQASLTYKGKRLYLGTFNTTEEASEAYIKAKEELNG